MENQSQQTASMENQSQKKPRILCLHGFRTSASILQKLILRWPEDVLEKLDLVFLDAPFPARGKSDVEGIFDPPYYEWFQGNEVCVSIFPFSLTDYVSPKQNRFNNFFKCRILLSIQILKNAWLT